MERVTISLETVQKFGANGAMIEALLAEGVKFRQAREMTGISRGTYFHYKKELREYEKNSDQRKGVSG